MDYLEYASKDQLSTKGFSKNQISEHDKAVQEYAEEISKAYTYKTVYYPGIKQTAILTSWTEDKNGCIGGTGYDYIDENTISRGDDMKFIFVSGDKSSENIIEPDKNTTSID